MTFLLVYITGNYVFRICLIGEIQTGVSPINYLKFKKYKLKKLPEEL